MTTEVDPKELLGKVQDDDVRSQLESVFDELSGSALRQQVEDLKAENKTFKQQMRTRAFQDAGFDPESGPGKALAKLYEGEPDPEKIREAADEYGLNPNGEATQSTGQQQKPEPSGDERLSQVSQGAIPARDPSTDDVIAKAEAEKDWDTFNRASAQKLEAARRAS